MNVIIFGKYSDMVEQGPRCITYVLGVCWRHLVEGSFVGHSVPTEEGNLWMRVVIPADAANQQIPCGNRIANKTSCCE